MSGPPGLAKRRGSTAFRVPRICVQTVTAVSERASHLLNGHFVSSGRQGSCMVWGPGLGRQSMMVLELSLSPSLSFSLSFSPLPLSLLYSGD